MATLRNEALFFREAERHLFYQHVKCAFLKGSDKCTKFFHDLVKMNSKRNFIPGLYKEDGSVTNSL